MTRTLAVENLDIYKIDMSYVDGMNRYILDQRIELIKDMDNIIRGCIKKEIKKYGSIIKRYNSWKEFIEDNIVITISRMQRGEIQSLIYRGKTVKRFVFDYQMI